MISRKKASVAVILLAFLCWVGYFCLIWSHMLVVSADGVKAGYWQFWADTPAHLSYVSALAYRHSFPAEHPLYLGRAFSYPFLADALSAVLVRLGVSIFRAYSAIGWVLAVTFLGMFVWFQTMFLKSRKAAVIALYVFLLNGAWGFIHFFEDVATKGLAQTVEHLPSYTYDPDRGVEMLNIILSTLQPQRAFLLGLPVGLLILGGLWKVWESGWWNSYGYLIGLGLLTGLLPIIHPHTLIVVFGVTMWLMLLTVRRKGWWSTWMAYGIPALAIGLPLLLAFSLGTVEASFFRWYPGWLAPKHGLNWFVFWWINWGIFPWLALGGFWLLRRRQKLFVVPFGGLFVLSNLVLFQPHDWDNTKIFTWIFLIGSGLVAVFLVKLAKRGALGVIAAVGLSAVLMFSGFLEAVRLLDRTNLELGMYTGEEVALAEKVRDQTESNSVFLTSDQHNHWVPNLTGRQIVMGFQGWLWTYGIDSSDRNRDVRAMYAGGPSARLLLDEYGVDYVVIGPNEREHFAANVEWYERTFPVAVESPLFSIFQVVR